MLRAGPRVFDKVTFHVTITTCLVGKNGDVWERGRSRSKNFHKLSHYINFHWNYKYYVKNYKLLKKLAFVLHARRGKILKMHLRLILIETRQYWPKTSVHPLEAANELSVAGSRVHDTTFKTLPVSHAKRKKWFSDHPPRYLRIVLTENHVAEGFDSYSKVDR